MLWKSGLPSPTMIVPSLMAVEKPASGSTEMPCPPSFSSMCPRLIVVVSYRRRLGTS